MKTHYKQSPKKYNFYFFQIMHYAICNTYLHILCSYEIVYNIHD